jgi:hypothetical protein
LIHIIQKETIEKELVPRRSETCGNEIHILERELASDLPYKYRCDDI